MFTKVARVQLCANHVQHIERLSCATCCATWYKGTAQLLTGFIRSLNLLESPWIFKVLFKALESPWKMAKLPYLLENSLKFHPVRAHSRQSKQRVWPYGRRAIPFGASSASDWQHAWNTGGRDLWACADYSLPCRCAHATVDFRFRIRATVWFVFANWTFKNAWWKLCVQLIVVVETRVCWMAASAERKQICVFLPCVQKSDRRESDGRVRHRKPRKRQETYRTF